MKDINNDKSFGDMAAEAWQALGAITRFVGNTMAHMSWQALLMTCIGLALLFTVIATVLPLALFLFCAVLVVKLATALFTPKQQHHDTH